MMSDEIENYDPFKVPDGTIKNALVPFATLPDGSPATFPLITIAGVKPGPTGLIVGGIHGDEYEGPQALFHLASTIKAETLSGRLLIVPIANLSAFFAGTRTSPLDQQNLARIFPGDANGTPSFKLAHALFTKLVEKADFLIDCHSGGVRLAFLDVAGYYGEDQDISAALSNESLGLAKAMGLSHVWRLPGREGVLSYEAMRRGIPATGGEIGGRGGCLAEDAAGYYNGIMNVLSQRNMIEGYKKFTQKIYENCLVGDWTLAPVSGMIENYVAIGDRVQKDMLLASIHDPFGNVLAEMRAEFNGLIMAVRHLRSTDAGEWATCLVAEVPL